MGQSSDTISGGSGRFDRLRPPVEVDPSLVEVRRGVEGDAALGDRTVEVLDRAEVLVGERLVEHRPEALGRLELGAVGRQVDEPDALGDGQPGLRVPAGVVEDEDDDPVATGPGLAGEEGEERLEERLRHPVRQVPEHLARGRLHEGGHVEPLEAVVAGCARSLAPRRPDAAEDRLQPDAVLVGGEDLDDLARMLLGLLGEDGGELSLNASCSSAVARAGCSGRGTWTDQPTARSASQPRALGPPGRPPAAPPTRAGPPPSRAPAPPPSTPRPCGWSTARRRAAAPPGGPAACRAAPASGPSASSRCAVAGRRARPDRRRCTAPSASRPTAPRTRSSRPPRPPRDPSPAARSPGRAGPSGRPPRRGTAPPAPPRSSVPPPPPRVRLPRAKAQPTGCVTPQEPSPNTSAGNRITHPPSEVRRVDLV